MISYFKPKSFETIGNKILYDFVGIKLYKKYLPFTGDIARKWASKKQLKTNHADRITDLYRYERETRKNEMRHIFGLILFIILAFIVDKKLNIFDIIFLTFLNLYINLYPIFLQRYNRIRIVKVLLNNNLESPYT